MASPTLENFCCLSNDDGVGNMTEPNTTMHTIVFKLPAYKTYIYNGMCLSASCVSIVGTIYQILPRRSSNGNSQATRSLSSYRRQNQIICWLAVADILAAVGLLVRSCLWLAGHLPDLGKSGSPDFAHIFCAVATYWIQYFYICTYFWTFCYALDVYSLLREKPSKMKVYHVLSWFLSWVVCTLGFFLLFMPNTWLHCQHDTAYLLPHYLASYLPILLVMIVNPILYILSTKLVKESIKRRRMQYTDHERQIVSSIQKKFFLVMVVFYICWFPNILNGILLLSRQHGGNVPHGVLMVVWHFMAVTNPLQSFLNSLVYRGVAGCNCVVPRCCQSAERRSHNLQVSGRHTPHQFTDSCSETAPLLISFRNKLHDRNS